MHENQPDLIHRKHSNSTDACEHGFGIGYYNDRCTYTCYGTVARDALSYRGTRVDRKIKRPFTTTRGEPYKVYSRPRARARNAASREHVTSLSIEEGAEEREKESAAAFFSVSPLYAELCRVFRSRGASILAILSPASIILICEWACVAHAGANWRDNDVLFSSAYGGKKNVGTHAWLAQRANARVGTFYYALVKCQKSWEW